jgi:flagellar biosynthesis protein FliQ
MDTTQITDLIHRALYTATIVVGPILVICLIIGIVISIFQAATQIHEQSLTFVPKIVVVLILLIFAGNWMVVQVSDFTKEAFNLLANMN